MPDHRIGPTTKRLQLRAFEARDAEDFFRLNSHPDVIRFTGEPPLRSAEEAAAAIAAYPDWDQVGFGRWACILKETQRMIGFCGLKFLPEFAAVDLGYRFLPEYWGQGLATESSLAAVRFGFEVLQLEEIIGLVIPANTASVRVLEKVGLQPAGEVLYDGDQVLKFTLRRADWISAQQTPHTG